MRDEVATSEIACANDRIARAEAVRNRRHAKLTQQQRVYSLFES